MAYIKTGFPRGRPRKGDSRPNTPGGEAQRKYREKKLAENSVEFRKENARKQREWYQKNPARAREIKKNYIRRQKLLEENQGKPLRVYM